MITRKNHEMRGAFIGGRQKSTYDLAANLFANVEIPEWQRDGTPCGAPDVDRNIFFPHVGSNNGADASQICLTRCAHRGECAAMAYRNGEQYGVWGGVNCTVTDYRPRSEIRSRLAAMAAEHGIDVGHRELPVTA